MSGFADDLDLNDKANPCVEPAPKIGIVVRFGGRQHPTILTVGEPETIQFGNFPVEVEVVEIYRQKLRPAKAPPYIWIIRTVSWGDKIRAMTEENARRLFYQRYGTEEDIVEIYPEIS